MIDLNPKTGMLVRCVVLLLVCVCCPAQATAGAGAYSGSSSCHQCHETFYELWAPSHHGLAMQPYTSEFAQAQLTPHPNPVKIGAFSYRAYIDKQQGFILEQGPEGEKKYQIAHVLGRRCRRQDREGYEGPPSHVFCRLPSPTTISIQSKAKARARKT